MGRTHVGDDAVDELRNVVDKAEELLRSLGENGEDIAADLKDRVSSTLNAARHRIGELESSAREATTSAAETADEYVSANPWMAVAVAAAVGLLAGAALTRR